MSETSTLTVLVSGLRNTSGNLCVALFDSPDGYPNDSSEAIRVSSVLINNADSQLVTFEDLPYGNYAIAVFHDENSDSELNTGFLGIPKEGIGFSGNPQIWRGLPSYEKVQFDFTSAQTTVAIAIKYF